MYKKKWFLKPICLIILTQAANFSKQDSYPALHHQKMILENKNMFSFSRLNRFLFIGDVNDKIWGWQVLNFRVLTHGFPLYLAAWSVTSAFNYVLSGTNSRYVLLA